MKRKNKINLILVFVTNALCISMTICGIAPVLILKKKLELGYEFSIPALLWILFVTTVTTKYFVMGKINKE